jgi:hypothetical protein
MAAPFIFINSYAIKEGKLEDLRQFLQGFFKVMEANEPRLVALNGYVNEDGTEVSFVQVHLDVASLEHYQQVAHEHMAAGRPFLKATTSIQVYGKPSDLVLERAGRHARLGVSVSVKPEHLGGFTRLQAPLAEPAFQKSTERKGGHTRA